MVDATIYFLYVSGVKPLSRFLTVGMLFFGPWIGVFSAVHTAATSLTIDAEAQFRFAEQYFATENYDSAIAEYERYIYFFPEGNHVETATYKIGVSHLHSGRWTDALNVFTHILKNYGDTDTAIKSLLWISECHVRQQQFGAAIPPLQDLIRISPNQATQDEAYYRMGWIYIETMQWENARRTFEKISLENRERYQLTNLLAELDQHTEIQRKSPELAGVLAIVPGVGYAYCDRPYDALIAFLLNIGLAFAAYESFDQDLYALSGVIAFVELGFYAGNIYGSVNSAHKYNQSGTDSFIEGLRYRTKVQLTAASRSEPGMESMVLTIAYFF